MAKRKSRSRSSNKALSYIKYGAIILAIVGAIMACFAYVSYNDYSFSGFQVIFGYTGKAGSYVVLSKEILKFSFVALLAVLLPLVGSFSVISKNKIVKLIGAILMVAGCVLCFLVPNFMVFADNAVKTIFSNGALGVGAILSGVFFALGAVCNVYAVIEK